MKIKVSEIMDNIPEAERHPRKPDNADAPPSMLGAQGVRYVDESAFANAP
jgi:hypothetical protein